MFDQTFVNTHAQTRKPWTVALSLGLQTGIVAILLILPMLRPEVLHPKLEVPIWMPLQPLKPQPAPELRQIQRSSSTQPRPVFDQLFHAPNHVPRTIDLTPDVPEIQNLMLVGPADSSGGTSGIPGLSTLPERPEPRPAAPKTKPESAKGPMHVSTGVQSAKLMFAPKPGYPALAKSARIQGTVRIEAIIGADGTIRNLQVMSGPPLLVKAALDAVSQWRYQPTLLNGSPVEVITEIDVTFMLQ